MNAMPKDGEEVETPFENGVGEYLRKSREALNLGCAEVAAGLHLNGSIITALEEGDNDALPSPVFIQGYLRKYARLLNIPEEPLLTAYKQQQPHAHKHTKRNGPLTGAAITSEIRSSHAVVRLITWFIALGLVALLIVWWQGDMGWPTGQLEESQSAITQDVELEEMPLNAEAADEQNLPAFVTPQLAELPENELQPETVDAETHQMESMQSEPSLSQLSVDIIKKNRLDDQVASALEATETEAVAAQEPALDAASSVANMLVADNVEPIASLPIDYANSIVIEFSETCWTEIRGFNGSYKLLGSMQKGKRYVLDGEPPYTFILGNSQAATLTIKGQKFDIEAHSTGNIARFVLQADDISTP